MRRWLGLPLVLLLVAACAGPMRRGAALYEAGRYIEAAEVFEHTEASLADARPRDRAEYGLYRGLTMLALGDLPSAQRWLAYARASSDTAARPSSGLREGDRRKLDAGWAALGDALGGDPTGDETVLAATESEPGPSAPPPPKAQ